LGQTGMDELSEAQQSGSAAEIISLSHRLPPMPVMFDRRELDKILQVYSRMVAAGEWRDYAIDSDRERAVFSIYRRHSEYPLYKVEKHPKLARKQGAFSVISANGVILKRGHELEQVLAVFNKSLKLVEG
jgi:Zn-finger nucleic acid-binding protein